MLDGSVHPSKFQPSEFLTLCQYKAWGFYITRMTECHWELVLLCLVVLWISWNRLISNQSNVPFD